MPELSSDLISHLTVSPHTHTHTQRLPSPCYYQMHQKIIMTILSEREHTPRCIPSKFHNIVSVLQTFFAITDQTGAAIREQKILYPSILHLFLVSELDQDWVSFHIKWKLIVICHEQKWDEKKNSSSSSKYKDKIVTRHEHEFSSLLARKKSHEP